MTTPRKRFNYTTATVAEIVEHFKRSTPQAIYNVRYGYSDTALCAKIEEAYRTYKLDMLTQKLDSCKKP